MKEPRKPPKQPWEKELIELTKYDWSIAVGLHPKHKNCPLDLRVANVLMQKADGGTCLMWATQQSIAKLVGVADERQVRTAMHRLEESGAIIKKRIADLQPETFESLGEKMNGNRNKRGVVYTLKLFWAMETFEQYANRSPAEPRHLRKKREGHRTTIVRQHRTTIVRSGQDYDSPPYTTVGNYTDTKGAFEGKEPIKVSTAPSYGDEDSGDYAFPIPASVAEGERMLDEMLSGTRESDPVRRFFRQKLFAGEFMKSTLDAWRNANAA